MAGLDGPAFSGANYKDSCFCQALSGKFPVYKYIRHVMDLDAILTGTCLS
jgi:hypothetical protein